MLADNISYSAKTIAISNKRRRKTKKNRHKGGRVIDWGQIKMVSNEKRILKRSKFFHKYLVVS